MSASSNANSKTPQRHRHFFSQRGRSVPLVHLWLWFCYSPDGNQTFKHLQVVIIEVHTLAITAITMHCERARNKPSLATDSRQAVPCLPCRVAELGVTVEPGNPTGKLSRVSPTCFGSTESCLPSLPSEESLLQRESPHRLFAKRKRSDKTVDPLGRVPAVIKMASTRKAQGSCSPPSASIAIFKRSTPPGPCILLPFGEIKASQYINHRHFHPCGPRGVRLERSTMELREAHGGGASSC